MVDWQESVRQHLEEVARGNKAETPCIELKSTDVYWRETKRHNFYRDVAAICNSGRREDERYIIVGVRQPPKPCLFNEDWWPVGEDEVGRLNDSLRDNIHAQLDPPVNVTYGECCVNLAGGDAGAVGVYRIEDLEDRPILVNRDNEMWVRFGSPSPARRPATTRQQEKLYWERFRYRAHEERVDAAFGRGATLKPVALFVSDEDPAIREQAYEWLHRIDETRALVYLLGALLTESDIRALERLQSAADRHLAKRPEDTWRVEQALRIRASGLDDLQPEGRMAVITHLRQLVSSLSDLEDLSDTLSWLSRQRNDPQAAHDAEMLLNELGDTRAPKPTSVMVAGVALNSGAAELTGRRWRLPDTSWLGLLHRLIGAFFRQPDKR